ncbi:phage Gp37Gp68 [Rhodobacteraceae bacterium KLH11]|nr:phage Gp37Gp68 [Rhodobacteraceae bacterium KLH11]
MGNQSKIEWTERTWNPIVGCSLASPGCTNCYAMRMAYRLSKNPGTPQYHGTAKMANGKPVFTGKLNLAENALLEPLRRKVPTTYFVNSMGDLFHEDMPDEWIDRVFAVMALCPQHTFQVLTKRADRMLEYVSCLPDCLEPFAWSPERLEKEAKAIGMTLGWDHDVMANRAYEAMQDWPLPNVWLGVSVEDQRRANERVPQLLQTPAAIRFISAEPLLGPVDLRKWLSGCYECAETCGHRVAHCTDEERCSDCGAEVGAPGKPFNGEHCPNCGGYLEAVCEHCGSHMVCDHPDTPNIDQVIVGGESGPNARPMHPDWARSLRDQCKAAGTAFFFKQWGEWVPWEPRTEPLWSSQNLRTDDRHVLFPADFDLSSDWDDGLGLLEYGHVAFQRVGKKAAGRVLDGCEWNEMPERIAA